VHAGFGWGRLKERDHLKDLGLDGRVIIKCIIAVPILMSETLIKLFTIKFSLSSILRGSEATL
jgi:hypothetical protein